MNSILSRAAAIGAAAALLCVSVVQAQTPSQRSLTGSVELEGSPVAAVPVTLHRVTPDESGPVSSQLTSAAGTFDFTLPAADSTRFEVFFVTAEYLSVRYFGQPVHGGAAPDGYAVAVHDTASSLPGALRVTRRDVVLIPEAQGGWEANEIIRLRNSAERTLVSAGGLPTWEMRLPEGTTDFQAGEGELTAAEVVQMGDRVMLVSSLLPGQREIFLRYRIPADLERAVLPVSTPTDTFHVFVGQPSPAIEVGGLETTNVVNVQGERFVQYGTTGVESGDDITLEWEAPTGPPLSPEMAGGVAALLILLVGSAFAFRSHDGRVASDASPAAG